MATAKPSSTPRLSLQEALDKGLGYFSETVVVRGKVAGLLTNEADERAKRTAVEAAKNALIEVQKAMDFKNPATSSKAVKSRMRKALKELDNVPDDRPKAQQYLERMKEAFEELIEETEDGNELVLEADYALKQYIQHFENNAENIDAQILKELTDRGVPEGLKSIAPALDAVRGNCHTELAQIKKDVEELDKSIAEKKGKLQDAMSIELTDAELKSAAKKAERRQQKEMSKQQQDFAATIKDRKADQDHRAGLQGYRAGKDNILHADGQRKVIEVATAMDKKIKGAESIDNSALLIEIKELMDQRDEAKKQAVRLAVIAEHLTEKIPGFKAVIPADDDTQYEPFLLTLVKEEGAVAITTSAVQEANVVNSDYAGGYDYERAMQYLAKQ